MSDWGSCTACGLSFHSRTDAHSHGCAGKPAPPNTPKETDCEVREWTLNAPERHWLTCQDDNCERAYCVGRRESVSALQKIREENDELRERYELACNSDNAWREKAEEAKALLGECRELLARLMPSWLPEIVRADKRKLMDKLKEALNGK